MISYIKGKIISIEPQEVIVVVQNIGYGIHVSTSLASSVLSGQEIELFTYQHVREDSLDLFGFQTNYELGMFKKLIGISGIGPKSALGILSSVSVEQLEEAITTGNAAVLTKISGVGKKTAERIVLELKGKVLPGATSHLSAAGSMDLEVMEALEQLGYRADQARDALKSLQGDFSGSDEKLKAALKYLGR